MSLLGRVSLGRIAYEQGKYEEAVAAFDQVLPEDPANIRIWNHRTSALLRLDRPEANESSLQALAIDPTNATAWRNRAVVLYRLGDLPEASRHMERALALTPEGHPTHAEIEKMVVALRDALDVKLDAPQGEHEGNPWDRAPVVSDDADLTLEFDSRGQARVTVLATKRATELRIRARSKSGSLELFGRYTPPPAPAPTEFEGTGKDTDKRFTVSRSGMPPIRAVPLYVLIARKTGNPSNCRVNIRFALDNSPELESPGFNWPDSPSERDLKDLFDAWEAADPATDKFASLEAGFRRTSGFDLSLLDRFKRELRDDDNAASAGRILKAQLDLEFADPDYIRDNWRDIRTRYRLESLAPELRGQNLLQVPHEFAKTHAVGENKRVQPGGFVRWSLEDLNDVSGFTLRVRVFVRESRPETTAKIVLASGQGGWEINLKDREWVVRTGSDTEFATRLKLGRWTTIRCQVVAEGGRARNARLVAISIDDELLLERGTLNGPLHRFEVSAGDSPLLIAGVELSR